MFFYVLLSWYGLSSTRPAQVWMVEHCISYKTISIGKMWSLILKTMWTRVKIFFKPVVIACLHCFREQQPKKYLLAFYQLPKLLSITTLTSAILHTHRQHHKKEVDSLNEYAKELLTLGLLRHSHCYHNITTFSHQNWPNSWTCCCCYWCQTVCPYQLVLVPDLPDLPVLVNSSYLFL